MGQTDINKILILMNILSLKAGRLNSLYFQFIRLGFYRGQCFELCGLLHYAMPIKLNAL